LKDKSRLLDFQEIKDVARSHFKLLYLAKDMVDLEIIATMLEKITTIITIEENVELMKLIDDPNILNVIYNLSLDKAPSTDRFSIHFLDIFGA
jgi:hypothetical protein